jgi:hypothetical protein
VIARKVSFGSQSEAGAKTREILMSVLHTLRKRRADAQAHFKWVLDQLAADPQRDPFALLFRSDTSWPTPCLYRAGRSRVSASVRIPDIAFYHPRLRDCSLPWFPLDTHCR